MHSTDSSTSGALTVDTVSFSSQSQNVAAMVTAMMDGTAGGAERRKDEPCQLLPVNGYFKQLQDYYLAKTERVNNSAKANAAVEAGGEFPNDSVTLSSDAVELTSPVPPPNCYTYLDTLTTSDKAVVKAATGWDIDADPLGETASPEAMQVVGRLNLDRSSGALTGDIDESYIDKLIHENLAPQAFQVTAPLSVLYKAQAYLNKTQQA